MLAEAAALLALAAPGDAAYAFAVSVARDGPRPAASAAEARAHRRIERRFRAAGLAVRVQRFSTPRGRSRNVIGVRDGSARLPAGPDGPHRLDAGRAGRRGQRVRARRAGGARAAAARPALRRLARRHGRRGAALHGLAGPPGRARAGARPCRGGGCATRSRSTRSARARGCACARRSPRRGGASSASCCGRRSRPAPGSDWQRDSGTGNSDHRELELSGRRAVKLGVVDNPCRHMACDTPDRLRRALPGRVRLLRV